MKQMLTQRKFQKEINSGQENNNATNYQNLRSRSAKLPEKSNTDDGLSKVVWTKEFMEKIRRSNERARFNEKQK